MGKVLRFIFTLYCLIPFLFSFIIVIPLYFIIFNFFSKKKAPHIAHALSRCWASYLLFFFMIRAKVKNRNYIDPKRTYVFVANHLSFLDIPLYARACSNTFRFLAKEELTKVPLMGYVVKNLYITVNRGDKADRSKSLEKMKASLADNISVFLAPEGTRNKTENALLDFKDGAFRLAIAAQVPIAILTVKNTNHLLPASGIPLISPGVVIGEWSNVIETKGMTENDVEMLKDKVRSIMLQMLQS